MKYVECLAINNTTHKASVFIKHLSFCIYLTRIITFIINHSQIIINATK